jgi:hypothetical protein
MLAYLAVGIVGATAAYFGFNVFSQKIPIVDGHCQSTFR